MLYCQLCRELKNETMNVVLNGDWNARVCHAHGASTIAAYDEIKGEKRARIHKNLRGFNLSKMVKMQHGGFRSVISGRQIFSKYETAMKHLRAFLDV